MRISVLIFIVFIHQFSLAQKQSNSGNTYPYSKYTGKSFEREFESKDKEISGYCDTIKYCKNSLHSTFASDSTYQISMKLFEKNDSTFYEHYYSFEGRFLIDTKGNIILFGDHPFDSDSIRIIDIVYEAYIQTYYFEFKLNAIYNWTYKRKLRAYCDGDCTLSKYE
jgi:hypothetical protein